MKRFSIILTAILFLALLFGYATSLFQVEDLKRDKQDLTRLLNKEKELERILFIQNAYLQTQVVAKNKPSKVAKSSGSRVDKSAPVKETKVSSCAAKKIKGNRGYLIKDGKSTF